MFCSNNNNKKGGRNEPTTLALHLLFHLSPSINNKMKDSLIRRWMAAVDKKITYGIVLLHRCSS